MGINTTRDQQQQQQQQQQRDLQLAQLQLYDSDCVNPKAFIYPINSHLMNVNEKKSNFNSFFCVTAQNNEIELLKIDFESDEV